MGAFGNGKVHLGTEMGNKNAKQKIGEGIKADVYAGMIYERMGGVFEMYDVLSEQRR